MISKQLKSLHADYKRTKIKCLELCDTLNKQMPDHDHYEIFEHQIHKIIDKAMQKKQQEQAKTTMVRQIARLYELQRELMYQLQKTGFRKAGVPHYSHPYKFSECLPSNLPLYHPQKSQPQLKIDHMSTYMQQLQQSMRGLAKQQIDPKNLNFVKLLPQYQQILRKLERYMMREEEMERIINKEVEAEIRRITNKGKVGDEEKYVLVRVDDKQLEKPLVEYQDQDQSIGLVQQAKKKESKRRNNHYSPLEQILEKPQQSASTINQQKTLSKSKQKNLSPLAMSKKYSKLSQPIDPNTEQDPDNNYVYMVKKINPDSQLNSSILSSISSLRNMRKKVFDDDIWDQFQKI